MYNYSVLYCFISGRHYTDCADRQKNWPLIYILQLEYAAGEADVNANFTYTIQHKSLASDPMSAPMTFSIYCKSLSWHFKSQYTTKYYQVTQIN